MARSYNSNMWRKTIILTTAMIVIGFGLIIGNLVRWQLVRGEELRSKAIDQSLRSTELTPMRGTVYDVTGKKVLAQSASVWTVVLEPNYIKDGDEVNNGDIIAEFTGRSGQNSGSRLRGSSGKDPQKQLFRVCEAQSGNGSAR